MSTQPFIKGSIDVYKTVCPGERVLLTCTVQASATLTWTSTQYIGSNTAVEFNRGFDRKGEGKSISLPNGDTSLFQLVSLANDDMEANMLIKVDGSVPNATISCYNDGQQSKDRHLILAGEIEMTSYF